MAVSKTAATAMASAIGACLMLSSCWYVKQPYYFLAERARAVPVSKLACDPGSDAALVGFLRRVDDIRSFAVDVLGMRPTANYTKFVAMDKDYVADVVSACASDSFERHLWRYPFVGSLPYKGFYERKDAEREAARLKKAGLDVMIRGVEAFSSLGYFKDPLYSFMVGYDVDAMAEIVLHESAHATLFVKGAEQFNEEFATFVGRKAAELYVADRYGADSEEARARMERSADASAFSAYLEGTAHLLEAEYAAGRAEKRPVAEAKARIIAERADEYRRAAPSLFKSQAYIGFDMGSINNAYIDLYRLYEEDLGLYGRFFSGPANGDLRAFIAMVSGLAASRSSDIKRAMEEAIQD